MQIYLNIIYIYIYMYIYIFIFIILTVKCRSCFLLYYSSLNYIPIPSLTLSCLWVVFQLSPVSSKCTVRKSAVRVLTSRTYTENHFDFADFSPAVWQIFVVRFSCLFSGPGYVLTCSCPKQECFTAITARTRPKNCQIQIFYTTM